ncbi:DUF6416 domain-containing protein [Lentzea sp.]|uniref:DUF6416 domain-containing protein n=1 Tax=Lentzea sp. TaxID=56099 RepID=UPI002CA6C12F|nr:DUF6416 domain-containing protein [Lentzea sp.]HUQ58328.1 DUF6416 domain-containing protein [Lentzea sp.]
MIDATVEMPEEPADSPTGRLPRWSGSDRNLAETYWRKLSAPAKDLFSVLIDHPEEKFTGDELAQKLGLPGGRQSLKSVLGWPGRYCKEFGRTWPWAWDYPKGETARFWMTAEVAEIFRQAREHRPARRIKAVSRDEPVRP